MQDLYMEPTKYTPYIRFQEEKHLLEITGESYPEDTASFYRPVFEWVEKYINANPETEVLLRVEINYFNSSSSKALFDLFDLFEQAAQDGKPVHVEWIYDPDDDIALEYGEDFQMDLESLDFKLQEKESE